MKSKLKSAIQVIEALGGTAAVARWLACDFRRVWNWRSRGLPTAVYLIMAEALRDRGYSADPSLWGIQPRAGRRGGKTLGK